MSIHPNSRSQQATPTFSIYPHSIHPPSIPLPIHPSVYLSTHLSMHPTIHPCTHPSIHAPIHPPIYLPIHPSIYPSTHLSTHPSTHPFVHSSIQPLSLLDDRVIHQDIPAKQWGGVIFYGNLLINRPCARVNEDERHKERERERVGG